MSDQFRFDVFLSHSSQDTLRVRDIARRLKRDGFVVWFDESVQEPSGSISAQIENALEQSRVLVLCVSSNTFGAEWAQIEAGTFRFRDPANPGRRFVPLRLDQTPVPDALAQFLFVDWSTDDREANYPELVAACRARQTGREADAAARRLPSERRVRLPHGKRVVGYAFSPDGKRALTCGTDALVRLWEMETARCLATFSGHKHTVNFAAWSSDNRRFLSSADDTTVRLWDSETGRCLRVFTGHKGQVWTVAWSADERSVYSAGGDSTIRVWDAETGTLVKVLSGHNAGVWSVAGTADGKRAISGSSDMTMRLWDLDSGRTVHRFDGHTGYVRCVALSPNGRLALSGSEDRTVRLWDLAENRCIRVLEGHMSTVAAVAWDENQRLVISGARDKTLRLWDLTTGEYLGVMEGHRGNITTVSWRHHQGRVFSGDATGRIFVWGTHLGRRHDAETSIPIRRATDQIQYTNAKVLIVGESGVGKTALSNYLAYNIRVEDDRPIASTDGAWATHWPLHHDRKQPGIEREIWLWDFAGQVDYRLVHQLFLDDAAAAVLVFNPQSENPFQGLGQWDRDLQRAAGRPFAKLLTAARIDRGGVLVDASTMQRFMQERGFLGTLHETSAKTGEGCDQLRDAIVASIDWQRIPETTSPALYHRLKHELLRLRDSGLVLIRQAELKQRLEMALRDEEFDFDELETVVGLLAGPGMIQRLDFGGFILLRPEVLSRYAAALVRTLRKHPQGLGCVSEDQFLFGDLDYQDFQRLPREDEKVVMRTLLETFISRAWCLRLQCDGSALLTFPSYFRRERRDQPRNPEVLLTYAFDGPADDIYATLVVRLHHTVAFQSTELWRSAADFSTQTGAALGFRLVRETEGRSLLEVYFAPDVDLNSRVVFLRYVHDHLTRHARSVVRFRHYACANRKCKYFDRTFRDREAIDDALAPGGCGKVFCGKCGKPILLRDAIERKFESPAVKEQARELGDEAQVVIDNESRELILVGHVFAVVAEAGQIYRGYTNSDHGIDGEIEFKDDDGDASGKRLYVQLKSGDAYLKKRRRDSAEVFQIKNARWADYWRQQAYAVMLVIRTSDGEIRWMDVTAYLQREAADQKGTRQIVFEGERFDAASVRRWRLKALRP